MFHHTVRTIKARENRNESFDFAIEIPSLDVLHVMVVNPVEFLCMNR